MNLIKSGWEIVKSNRRPYIVLNILWLYVLVILTLVVAAVYEVIEDVLMVKLGA